MGRPPNKTYVYVVRTTTEQARAFLSDTAAHKYADEHRRAGTLIAYDRYKYETSLVRPSG